MFLTASTVELSGVEWVERVFMKLTIISFVLFTFSDRLFASNQIAICWTLSVGRLIVVTDEFQLQRQVLSAFHTLASQMDLH